MKKPNLNEIVNALLEDAGGLDFNPQESRMFLQTLRLLSKGHPISSEQVTQIAADFDLSGDEADSALNWVAERNDDGHIAGLAGLSVNDWTHKFKVNGRNLTTWCALDTLFLPQMLKQTAEVRSPDPETKEMIQLIIGPDRVEQYAPSSAVVSIVIPKTVKKGLESAEEMWKAFCGFSHYFTSVETGQDWFSGRDMEPIFLSIDEGHQLGRLWFEDTLKYA